MADGGFGWSEGIAALSLGVSLFALAWAKTSADAARRANLIQLHTYHKDLFRDFRELYWCFQRRGYDITRDEIGAFHDHANTCQLYLSKGLSADVFRYFISLRKLHSKRRAYHVCCEQIRIHAAPLVAYEDELKRLRENEARLESESLELLNTIDNLGDSILERMTQEISLTKLQPSLWSRFVAFYKKPYDWGDNQEPQ